MAGFVAVVILLLPWINPPGSKAAEEVNPPGDVVFEATWPNGLDADVDQWVAAGKATPVGYSNKGGKACNLLRDDLGALADPLEINHEMIVCRGVKIAGEYVFNLHLFRNNTETLPVPVNIRVSARMPDGTMREIVRSKKVMLDREGHERTVVRFRLNDDGSVVPDSLHNRFKPLRGAIARK